MLCLWRVGAWLRAARETCVLCGVGCDSQPGRFDVLCGVRVSIYLLPIIGHSDPPCPDRDPRMIVRATTTAWSITIVSTIEMRYASIAFICIHTLAYSEHRTFLSKRHLTSSGSLTLTVCGPSQDTMSERSDSEAPCGRRTVRR